MIYKTRGIIIKRKNFGEADRIVTIYTEKYGKISAIAKGVRKPLSKLGGYLELFYLVDFMLVEGKNLETVAGAQIIEDFPNLRKDLYYTQQAYYLAELIDKLLHEESENKEIFEMLYNSLVVLNKFEPRHLGGVYGKHSLLLRYFELQLLLQLGHQPEVEHCVKCRGKLDPKKIFWSNELGGVLCDNCRQFSETFLELSPESIKIIRLFLSSGIEAVNRLKIEKQLGKELEQIIDGFLRYVSEKEFNSKKYVREK